MKWSIAVLALLGLLAALGAAVLLTTLNVGLTGPEANAVDPEVTYLVATRDLQAMKVVESTDVEAQTTTLSQLPPDVYRNPVGVVGKVLSMAVVKGQAFTRSEFASDGSGVHLAAALPAGMRAVSVSIANHAGLEGILYPGSQVDVIATLQLPASGAARGDYVSTTLLEGVQVLAIEDKSIVSERSEDESVIRRTNSKRMITLLVDEGQAQVLQLATNHGQISLAMRNPLESSPPSVADATLLSELTEKFLKHAPVTMSSQGMSEPLVAEVPNSNEIVTSAEPSTDVNPEPSRAEVNDLPAVESGMPEEMTPEVRESAQKQWTMEIIRGRRVESKSFDVPPTKTSDASDQD